MVEVTYKYEVFNQQRYVVRKFKGDVLLEDIISSFEHLLDTMNVSADCAGILTDLSEASFRVKLKEIPKLSAFLNSRRELEALKLAALVHKPEEIVLPLMIVRKLPFLKIKPFSTYESAIEWICK